MAAASVVQETPREKRRDQDIEEDRCDLECRDPVEAELREGRRDDVERHRIGNAKGRLVLGDGGRMPVASEELAHTIGLKVRVGAEHERVGHDGELHEQEHREKSD